VADRERLLKASEEQHEADLRAAVHRCQEEREQEAAHMRQAHEADVQSRQQSFERTLQQKLEEHRESLERQAEDARAEQLAQQREHEGLLTRLQESHRATVEKCEEEKRALLREQGRALDELRAEILASAASEKEQMREQLKEDMRKLRRIARRAVSERADLQSQLDQTRMERQDLCDQVVRLRADLMMAEADFAARLRKAELRGYSIDGQRPVSHTPEPTTTTATKRHQLDADHAQRPQATESSKPSAQPYVPDPVAKKNVSKPKLEDASDFDPAMPLWARMLASEDDIRSGARTADSSGSRGLSTPGARLTTPGGLSWSLRTGSRGNY
jgi:hypothetical protein